MKSALFFTASASMVAFAVVACSSGSSGGGGGGGGGGGCGAYFDSYTAYSKQCGGNSFLNSRDRWLQYCQLLIGAPGASGAESALSQCAQDVSTATSTCASPSKSTACSTFMGALGSGTACGESVQCASGFCKGGGVMSSGSSSGETTTTATCGVCADKIAVGGACDQSKGDRCVKDASCVTSGSGGMGTCKAKIVNDVGGACGGKDSASCKDGLRCDFTMMKCAALSTAGGACDFDGDCATPLVCGADMVCAQPKATGAACTLAMDSFGNSGCARNETCNAMTSTCAATVQVDPGGTCDFSSRYCKAGSCNIMPGDGGISGSSTGTCPKIIADGQPCTNSAKDSVCDEFAECLAGKCTVFDPSTCK